MVLPTPPNSTDSIAATSVKLAPFWSSNPVAWFSVAESQFNLKNITADRTKYDYVVSSLSEEVITTVLDEISNPPEDNKYTSLKNKLITRNSESEELRLEKILSGSELGDRKPSEFYRHLSTTAGAMAIINADLIRRLWIRSLPNAVKLAVVAAGDKTIGELQDLADKIWEATQSGSVSSLTSTKQSVGLADLQKEINEIRKTLDLFTRERPRFSSRSSSRHRYSSRTRDKTPVKKELCWYHFKFRDKATKCQEGCKFKSHDKSKNLN